MTRDQGAKVLLITSSLEAAAEESSDRTDSAGEDTDDSRVKDEGRCESLMITDSYSQVLSWTGQVRVLGQAVAIDRAKKNSDESSTNKSLYRLLGAQNYQGVTAEEEAEHVGSDVIDGDDGHGEDVPEHPVL